ncbi:MAG: hypothetical protein M0Q21_07275 [Ignavibacteriaceae bacterium]|nr:hypothetical protein [Ignavibacteriaceae bacterium]
MTRTSIIKQITTEINYFDDVTLKSIFNYISFLKNRDMIDPTDEILANEDDYNKVREGLTQAAEGKTSAWDDVKTKMINEPIKELSVYELRELIAEIVKEAFQKVIENINTPIGDTNFHVIKEVQTAYKERKDSKTILKSKHVLSLQQKELMKLSENAFSEWDNAEDEIYDKM